MRPEFERDDVWQANVAGKFLDPFYRQRGWHVERYPGHHPNQRLHVDVTLRRGSEDHHIDEKILRGRRDGHRAIKVSVETWSCTIPGAERRGWFAKEERVEASILLICFSDVSDLSPTSWQSVTELDCIWIPFHPFRNWFWEQGEERFKEKINEQGNRSISREVPIAEILVAINGARRFTIGLADLRAGFVGYDDDGHFVHYCHCGKWGSHGEGVFMLQGKLGTWFCAQHKPTPASQPPPPPPSPPLPPTPVSTRNRDQPQADLLF